MTSTETSTENFCRFAGTADDGGTWSIAFYDGAPAMLCDTHGIPANGEAQETGVGLCFETERYVAEHDHDREGEPGRCRCGRDSTRCFGREDALAITADLEAQRAALASGA